MQKKECLLCHKRKPLDIFYIRQSDKKRGAWCLQCDSQGTFDVWIRNSKTPHEIHQYKALTLELLKYLRAFEHKGCFICHRHNRNGRKLYIDHDHKTDKVRGLLCHSCNIKLGKLRDNPPIDSPFYRYLTKAFPSMQTKYTRIENSSRHESVSAV